MPSKEKKYDALAFKADMQNRLTNKLAGFPPEERIRQIHELARSGPLGDWWQSLPKSPMTKTSTTQR